MKAKRMNKFVAVGLACIMFMSVVLATMPLGITSSYAETISPTDINDLGYLGSAVNLLREIDTTNGSDNILSKGKLKTVLQSDVSDFTVKTDSDGTSKGQGYTSSDFASLALEMGVDLSTKASGSSDFVIGSAKLESSFAMKMNSSIFASANVVYETYTYQRYLDTWTLNWDNEGMKGNVSKLRDNLQTNVYGALANTLPQSEWSPEDFFAEYGTHIIVSYQRGGEYTYSSIEISEKASTKVSVEAETAASGSGKVSSFGEGGFETKVSANETVEVDTEESEKKISIFSRGSSKTIGKNDLNDTDKINEWLDGVDDENAQIIANNYVELVAVWDLLPSKYASRKAELQNYYNEQVAKRSDDLLSKFVYKEVSESEYDYTDYSIIYDADDLNAIRIDLSGNYVLANDVDLSGIDWTPIGTIDAPFRGIFDGNGNTINNLNISSTSRSAIGLFGANSGTIKNVSVNGEITTDEQSDCEYIGGIIGYNNGMLENCQNQVVIKSAMQIIGAESAVDTDKNDIDLLGVDCDFSNAKILEPTSLSELQAISDSFTYSTSNPYREFIVDLRYVGATELNTTITVPASMYALKLIGDTATEYTGLNIIVANSNQEDCKNDKNQAFCYLALQNVKYISDSSHNAIKVNERILYIDSMGTENSITDGRTASSDIFAIEVTEILFVIGTANLTVTGAAGSIGTDYTNSQASSGADGAHPVSGTAGANGGDGYDGGYAISIKTLYVSLDGACAKFVGGTGGIGGHGQQGGNGNNNTEDESGGAGAKGGNGGNGGNGGVAVDSVENVYIYLGECSFVTGAGGKGGAGGNGGNGGNAHKIWFNGGNGGNGGDGGNGGNGGESQLMSLTTVNTKVYNTAVLSSYVSSVGEGTDGGTGGSGGQQSTGTTKTYTHGSTGSKGQSGATGIVAEMTSQMVTATGVYELITIEKSATDAQQYASDNESHLATIRSADEQAVIEKLIENVDSSLSKTYWIGGIRKTQGTNESKGDNDWYWVDDVDTIINDYDNDGMYTYADGTVAWTNFADGQPDDNSGSTTPRENYLQILSGSSGQWNDGQGSVECCFIIERSVAVSDNEIGINFATIGGIAGYNTANGVISYCWNNADIMLTIESNISAYGVASGIVGINEGSIISSYVDGSISLVANSTSWNKFADVEIYKFSKSVGEGSVTNCKYGVDSEDDEVVSPVYTLKVTSLGLLTNSKNEFIDFDAETYADNDYIIKSNYNEAIKTNWAQNRIHVESLSRTEFLVGEMLNEYVVELTYVKSADQTRATSKGYSYKYDFSEEGVTCLALSYTYNNEDEIKYIPVTIVSVKMIGISLSTNTGDVKTEYAYGEDFVYPVVIREMSDGMQYSITPETDSNLTVETTADMFKAGQYTVTVTYDAFEPIEYTITVAEKVVADTDPQFIVEEKIACAGSNVTIKISIKNNPGIMNAILALTYDDTVLVIDSVENGTALESSKFTQPGTFVSGCKFVWDGVDEDNLNDGVVLELNVTVLDTATVGAVYPIAISYSEGDLSDANLQTVDMAVVEGAITIIDYTPGDVNGDGKINGTDITLIRRYIAGGYDVEIITSAADVNSDGKINGTDITLIRRYIAGGYGVELQ